MRGWRGWRQGALSVAFTVVLLAPLAHAVPGPALLPSDADGGAGAVATQAATVACDASGNVSVCQALAQDPLSGAILAPTRKLEATVGLVTPPKDPFRPDGHEVSGATYTPPAALEPVADTVDPLPAPPGSQAQAQPEPVAVLPDSAPASPSQPVPAPGAEQPAPAPQAGFIEQAHGPAPADPAPAFTLASAAPAGPSARLGWMVGSFTILGLLSLLAGGALPPVRRALRPLGGLSLLVRIKSGSILEEPRRRRLFDIVVETPGVSVQELAELSGLSRRSVGHHLSVLARANLVQTQVLGRNRHHFAATTRLDAAQRQACALLRCERLRRTLALVADQPGLTQRRIAGWLGVQPSQSSADLKLLAEAHLIKGDRAGTAILYYACEQVAVVHAWALNAAYSGAAA